MKRLHTALIQNPLIAITICVFLVIGGLCVLPTPPDFWPTALRNPVNVDAIPNLGENQQIVFTRFAGQSPEDVEDQITYPLSSHFMGMEGIRTVRTFSRFGFSSLYLIFEESVPFDQARLKILEKLASLPQSLLPDGVQPTLGPDATALGQVYQYALVPESEGEWDLQKLSRLQEFDIRYALLSVPGVAEVATIGGRTGELEVSIDPLRLSHYGLSLEQVHGALRRLGKDTSAKTLEVNDVEFILRGVAQPSQLKHVSHSLVASVKGEHVTIADLGTVQWVPELDRSLFNFNGQATVGGIVTLREGANPLKALQMIENRVAVLNARLKDSSKARVRVQPFYNRRPLIGDTLQTLQSALQNTAVITSFVIVFLMGSLGGGLMVAGLLPLGILATFVAMKTLGIEANIVALSGIAIAIGVMADVGIVLVESMQQRLKDHKNSISALAQGASEVTLPLLLSVSTTLFSFLPVFYLQQAEGKLFQPLAATKTLAILLALILALCLLPSLARYSLHPRMQRLNVVFQWPILVFILGTLSQSWKPLGSESGWLGNSLTAAGIPLGTLLFFLWFQKLYPRLLVFFLRHKIVFYTPILLLVALGVLIWSRTGSEFMPRLKEGGFLYMPTTMPHASSEWIQKRLQETTAHIATIPEVKTAGGKAGRANTALDPAPLSMIETIIEIVPREEWRDSIRSEEDIWQEVLEVTQQPGLTSAPFLQPIEGRQVMLQSGIRSRFAIRIQGSDLGELQALSEEIEKLLKEVPGVLKASVYAHRLIGKPYLEAHFDRTRLEQYGLSVKQARFAFQAALAGIKGHQIRNGRERYPITMRYARDLRQTPEDLKNLLIPLQGGRSVRLHQIAKLSLRKGPQAIQGENSRLVTYVLFDKQPDHSTGEIAEQVQSHLKAAKVRADWEIAGTYENQIRANRRLMVLIPAALIIILLILSLLFQSFLQTLILFSSVLVSFSGGFVAVAIFDIHLSVAVWVGFIALFGIATDDGVLISAYLKEQWERTRPKTVAELHTAVLDAGKKRIRACLMTTATTLLGIMPVILSDGRGSEIMQPMAVPVLGGMSVSIVSLFVVPVTFALVQEMQLRLGQRKPFPSPDTDQSEA